MRFLFCISFFCWLLGGHAMIAHAQQHDSSSALQKKNEAAIQGVFVLEGIVKDATTGDPISFATLMFPGTGKGVKADVDGKFTFEDKSLPGDTLLVTSVGYAKQMLIIDRNLSYQKLQISLERSSIVIKDFVLHVSKDPALSLIKKVIRNKGTNNYDKASNYHYEVYNKLELDINKIPKKAFQVSPLLRKFDFIQNFIDSNSEDKPFLPLFLTETISDFYYQRKPKKMKELIKGSRISGYKNQSVSQLLGSMYQNINVYNNSILVFEVGFTSPIADDAPFFYRYQITDTQIVQGKRFYQVAFTPKRKGEHTFEGELWIHDTDYAVQKVYMVVTKEKNINWVNKATMMQEFTCFEDTLWFLTKDKFFVDFLPPQGDKIAGFMGRKTTSYRNISVNQAEIEAIFADKKNTSETELQPDALNRDENYWNSVRHDSLSKNEKSIYRMIDTIQHLPVYDHYYNLFYFLSTGIRKVGPIEIGPLYNLYSQNTVEGSRWRFTLGTTPNLSKSLYLQAYVAYGVKDQRYKYYGSALWLLKRNPRIYLYGEWKHDLDNHVNNYDDAGSLDNIFGTLGRKKVPWKLAFVDQQRFEFFRSYFNGFSYHFSAQRKKFSPYAPLPDIGNSVTGDSMQNRAIGSVEAGLELRFAYHERFVEGNYYRTSLGTKYPVLRLYMARGFKHILGGEYAYTKLQFTASHTKRIPHAGSLYYNLFAGKIFGTLPYSLLEVHPGNEFYYYDAHAFNMMYRYEYISDTYAGLIMEHSMGPLFFKYIPYIQKMKWRTFWNLKGVYGSLSDANRALNLTPSYSFQTLSRSPYLEVGTGIENILKIFRFDAVWRVLPNRNPGESAMRRFGVFGSMKFTF
jgi:hypothetical protein